MSVYREFLESKIKKTSESGIVVERANLHESLFEHQKDIVQWAIRGGRRAIFASFGLGKTRMQSEILRQLEKVEGGKYLVICPLGVKQEFQLVDGPALGMKIEYVRNDEEIKNSSTPFLITNYERVRDGGIDVNQFTGVSLDEASVLRSFGSKTYQTFLEIFRDVKYRYVATATPSPNKYKELIHYGGFLGIMDTGQALTRFFKRDSQKANNLTIYPHKEREFWLWMASWAVFIDKPSDLGYADDGYVLPGMDIQHHLVRVDHSTAGIDQRGQRKMFREAAISLQSAAKEKRDSLPERLKKTKEILGQYAPGTHFIIWHHLEAERYAIEKEIKNAVTVYGSQDMDEREKDIIDFAEGRIQILATKPEIAGSGTNFQRHCHVAIFMGIDYKFNDLIQSIHRIYRFQQNEEVHIHIVLAESESNIIRVIREKWDQHIKLTNSMREIVKKYGLVQKSMQKELERTIGSDRAEVKGQFYTAVNNDCVEEVKTMAENSIDLIHTSIPFSNHYEYTPSYNDFGHNEDNGRFFEQMDFLIPELLRILKPGRVAAIHVKDRILYGNVTGLGMPSVDPFSDMTTAAFTRHGFVFFGRITVVTDVVRENNQTYRLGWTENSKDSTKMGNGMSEYILLFRKLPSDTSRAYADDPVKKDKAEYQRRQWQIDAHGFWRSSGDRHIDADEITSWDMDKIITWWKNHSADSVYDYHEHVELGHKLEDRKRLPATFMLFAPVSKDPSVWTDVNRMLVMNSSQTQKKLQNHVCPLQFDIVERIISRFSNPGDLVLDPFGGLMTVPYMAVKMKRRGYGIELNSEYFTDGVNYLKAVEYKMAMPTLFDRLEIAS
jgi:DNA modification methylase